MKILICKEHIIQKDQKIKTENYMNIDVEINIISQCFIIKQNIFLLNIKLLILILMSDQNAYYYDIYEMHY